MYEKWLKMGIFAHNYRCYYDTTFPFFKQL